MYNRPTRPPASFRELNLDFLPIRLAVVSAAEIFAELPKLSREERRRLAAAIFELDEDAGLLSDCDRRADERFRELDMMEERDAIATRHGEV